MRRQAEILVVPRNSITVNCGHRRQYNPLTLIKIIGTPPTEFLVDHDENNKIPTTYFPKLFWRADGLWATVEINHSKPMGHGALLAIRHGFIRRASFGSIILASEWTEDEFGDLEVITACEPIDVSLTTDPAAYGTRVSIVGEPPAVRKSLPENPKARETLERFLARCGIDPTPDPVYVPKAKTIVSPPPPTISRPVPLHPRPWEVGSYVISSDLRLVGCTKR